MRPGTRLGRGMYSVPLAWFGWLDMRDRMPTWLSVALLVLLGVFAGLYWIVITVGIGYYWIVFGWWWRLAHRRAYGYRWNV